MECVDKVSCIIEPFKFRYSKVWREDHWLNPARISFSDNIGHLDLFVLLANLLANLINLGDNYGGWASTPLDHVAYFVSQRIDYVCSHTPEA